MKDVFLYCIELAGLVLVLAAVGVIQVWRNRLKSQGLPRYALLATALTTVAGFWLLLKTRFGTRFVTVDVVLTLAMVALFTYVVLWIGIRRVLNGRAHMTDIHESSILTMQYVGSRRDLPDFEATVLDEADAQAFVKTEGAPLR